MGSSSSSNDVGLQVERLLNGDASAVDSVIDALSSQSVARQMLIGSACGTLSGYTVGKVGRTAALALGSGILLILVAERQGLLRVNRNKVKEQLDKANAAVRQVVAAESPENAFRLWSRRNGKVVTDKLQRVVKNCPYFLGSYVGGSLLGLYFS